MIIEVTCLEVTCDECGPQWWHEHTDDGVVPHWPSLAEVLQALDADIAGPVEAGLDPVEPVAWWLDPAATMRRRWRRSARTAGPGAAARSPVTGPG